MLQTILALMSQAGPAIAALPEFAALIEQVKTTLSSNDQVTLQKAYELAKQDSDQAHSELQDLVKQHSAA